jgi:hypothetical protein
MKLYTFLFSLIIAFGAVYAQTENAIKTPSQASQLALANDLRDLPAAPSFLGFDLDSRKTKAAIYSFFIPGSGQTYLGYEIKGTAITLGFLGLGLATALNQNNFIGREDRLSTLMSDYKAATNYTAAENIWKDIQYEKGNRDNDYKRRNIFLALTAAAWLYNMIDITMFSEDQGTTVFSFGLPANQPRLNVQNSPEQIFGISFKLF